MLRIKKIIIIAVLVAGILATGLYFLLNPKHKITTVPLVTEVSSVEQAYDIAYTFVNKICPEPNLYMYGVSISGIEKLLDERVSMYSFVFDGMDRNHQHNLALESTFFQMIWK